MNVIRSWFTRNFSDPQVVVLATLLLLGFTLVLTTSEYLGPVFTGIVLAYLLEPAVRRLCSLGMRRIFAVIIVFLMFITLMGLFIARVAPMLLEQFQSAGSEFPRVVNDLRGWFKELPEKHDWVSQKWINDTLKGVENFGNKDQFQAMATTISSVVTNLAYILLYVFLTPLVVFFLMKDKVVILRWFQKRVSRDTGLSRRVWHDVDRQIANYVRGKFLQILINGLVTYITFSLMGVKYAALLSVVCGLSVLIPYLGMVLAVVPVIAMGYLQFGVGPEKDLNMFYWIIGAFFIIQMLDGNLLVPLLYSEAVDLHPVAIIVAILFFGGLWGVAGAFFAIPLATLVNAVIKAWPKAPHETYGDGMPDDTPPQNDLLAK